MTELQWWQIALVFLFGICTGLLIAHVILVCLVQDLMQRTVQRLRDAVRKSDA